MKKKIFIVLVLVFLIVLTTVTVCWAAFQRYTTTLSVSPISSHWGADRQFDYPNIWTQTYVDEFTYGSSAAEVDWSVVKSNTFLGIRWDYEVLEKLEEMYVLGWNQAMFYGKGNGERSFVVKTYYEGFNASTVYLNSMD